ncbi:MAG TPA: NADH-quinone oxidoreductase subunit C [Anaeromyxobacteraceae bacterium]|nr:NADH-quinone oxidoreductase subunit C [Anaeromyxobacteraceae bacterium]
MADLDRRILIARCAQAVEAADVPLLRPADFQQAVADALTAKARLVAWFGRPVPAGEGKALLTAVLASDREGTLGLLATVAGDSLPSLADEFPAVQLFERQLLEQFGVVPEGHPWPKPVRFERGMDAPSSFFEMEGESIHEVAVGPVHAGIIEPGHFRFLCHGEHVFHLEISLGYQHRGVQALLAGGPTRRTDALVESIAGDTVVGHALAAARAQEALAGATVPARAAALRAVALELERLANHVGDLGALAGDVAFLPTASYCGALRAEFLNALAEICGNRFGRALVVPGGVRFDLPDDAAARLAARVQDAWDRVDAAAGLFFRSPSVRDRTDGTGTVGPETARTLGLVGPAARASGLDVDARRSHPFPPYDARPIPRVTGEDGDVHSRAWVRFEEARHAALFVVDALSTLPPGPVRASVGPLAPDRVTVSLVEGWRGEICHAVVTGPDGRFARYEIVDPSFHDWMGLQVAMRGGQISDFPLCNKSFNLSYCGHDL